ncbi:MAG: hypothetical protein AB7G25_12570 [Sphingomonadaceae bacterium]
MNPEYINLGTPDTPFQGHTGWIFTSFGRFMAIWSEFEITIEVAITRLTKMNALDASIVLSGIQFGAKAEILKSLLSERGFEQSKSAVQKAIDIGKRNALIHSVPSGDEKSMRFAFVRREVKNTYKVREWDMSAEEFNEQVEKFLRAFYDVTISLDIKISDHTHEMRDSYGQRIDLSPQP